jgi:hypothetical protein
VSNHVFNFISMSPAFFINLKFFFMFRNCLLLVALLFTSNLMFAQHRQCGAMEVLSRQLLENPNLENNRVAIEQHTNQFIQSNGASDRAVITIPVVVHVVYNTAAQNVSDAQIQTQLTVLNADFRKLNSDVSGVPAAFAGLAADAEINFCLAQQDPAGLATTGIERRQTTVTSFSTNDNVKKFANGGLAAWDATKYLNLWVCNLSGGVLGYAQFPGGTLTTDGVVITYTGFGTLGTAAAPFNKGRTATHEVGHWLNLFHIWGDDGTGCTGSDNCADTPNQADENYGCPTYPQISCSNGTSGDMFMNYMDYTDDACMFMFTTGQKARMQALFAAGGSRVGLLTSVGCNAPSGATCGTPSGQNAASITITNATLGWTAVSGATSYNLRWKTTAGTTYTTVNALTGTSYALNSLSAGTSYDFSVQAVCSASTGSFAANTSFTTTTAPSCGTPTGQNVSAITAETATLGWTAVSGAISYNLRWRKGAATYTTVNGLTSTTYSLAGLASTTAYDFSVQAVCSTLSGAFAANTTFTTGAPTGGGNCLDVYEPNNSRTGAYVLSSIATPITGLIGSATDVDWFRFGNTSAQRRIKVDLTGLPADYDLKLYRSSTLLGTSENVGTADEFIIYNSNTVSSSYSANVYGYNGATSTSTCYTLTITLSTNNFKSDGNTDGETETFELPVAFENAGFGLYPNPATDRLNVEVPMSEEAEVMVNIIDPSGKSLISTTRALGKTDNRIEFDLSNLATGMYFVQVRNGETVKTRKLVVQK